MYCSKCGKEINKEMKFCIECGTAVGDSNTMQERMRAKGAIQNHLGISIVAIFLFLPLGIAAIIQSMKVDQYIMMGEYEIARTYSESARKLALIGICISVGLVILMLVLFLGVFSAVLYSIPYYVYY